jgi:hypothetical protein
VHPCVPEVTFVGQRVQLLVCTIQHLLCAVFLLAFIAVVTVSCVVPHKHTLNPKLLSVLSDCQLQS